MLTSSSSSLVFGSVLVGAHSSLTFTLTNTGKSTIDISSITSTNPVFTINPGIAMLHAGHSCTITVTFQPNAAGEADATLQIDFHPPQSLMRIPVSGAGVVPKHKDNKEGKEVKEAKESKEGAKDRKESKEGKEHKESKDTKEVGEKTADNKPVETKTVVLERLPQPHEGSQEGLEPGPGERTSPTQHSFITPEERPQLGPRKPQLPSDDVPE